MDDLSALRAHFKTVVEQLVSAHAAYQSLSTNEQLPPAVRAALIAAFAKVDWGAAGIQPIAKEPEPG